MLCTTTHKQHATHDTWHKNKATQHVTHGRMCWLTIDTRRLRSKLAQDPKVPFERTPLSRKHSSQKSPTGARQERAACAPCPVRVRTACHQNECVRCVAFAAVDVCKDSQQQRKEGRTYCNKRLYKVDGSRRQHDAEDKQVHGAAAVLRTLPTQHPVPLLRRCAAFAPARAAAASTTSCWLVSAHMPA